MKRRSLILLFSMFLLTAGGITVSSDVPFVSERSYEIKLGAHFECPECRIEYVWIDGVRWAYVYGPDGLLKDSYPDPE